MSPSTLRGRSSLIDHIGSNWSHIPQPQMSRCPKSAIYSFLLNIFFAQHSMLYTMRMPPIEAFDGSWPRSGKILIPPQARITCQSTSRVRPASRQVILSFQTLFTHAFQPELPPSSPSVSWSRIYSENQGMYSMTDDDVVSRCRS